MLKDLLSPLKLANIDFQSGIVQGPLAGYSNSAFRRLIWECSSPALCYTEMLPAKQICSENGQINRYTYKHSSEKFLCYQLSGNDPNCLADATVLVEKMGADCIDLNVGCPKPKIRKKGHGSALLAKPDLLYNCLAKMRKVTKKPLLAKIRIDGNSLDNYNALAVNAAAQAGVDAIVIHARHWQQNYDAECHWHQVANIIGDLSIPVILNGDLDNIANIKKAIQITKAKHIMIARKSMGQPDLINSLSNNCDVKVDLEKSIRWFISHMKYLLEIEPDYSVSLQSRAIAKYYFKNLPTIKTKDIMSAVMKNTDTKKTLALLNSYLS